MLFLSDMHLKSNQDPHATRLAPSAFRLQGGNSTQIDAIHDDGLGKSHKRGELRDRSVELVIGLEPREEEGEKGSLGVLLETAVEVRTSYSGTLPRVVVHRGRCATGSCMPSITTISLQRPCAILNNSSDATLHQRHIPKSAKNYERGAQTQRIWKHPEVSDIPKCVLHALFNAEYLRMPECKTARGAPAQHQAGLVIPVAGPSSSTYHAPLPPSYRTLMQLLLYSPR
ncbi:hypothetical protein DFH27DRAFT_634617 [Peziza echinospora]|nr:hypothetical protein DFH27DRAFT_634617 [Peziza echinospora]